MRAAGVGPCGRQRRGAPRALTPSHPPDAKPGAPRPPTYPAPRRPRPAPRRAAASCQTCWRRAAAPPHAVTAGARGAGAERRRAGKLSRARADGARPPPPCARTALLPPLRRPPRFKGGGGGGVGGGRRKGRRERRSTARPPPAAGTPRTADAAEVPALPADGARSAPRSSRVWRGAPPPRGGGARWRTDGAGPADPECAPRLASGGRRHSLLLTRRGISRSAVAGVEAGDECRGGIGTLCVPREGMSEGPAPWGRGGVPATRGELSPAGGKGERENHAGIENTQSSAQLGTSFLTKSFYSEKAVTHITSVLVPACCRSTCHTAAWFPPALLLLRAGQAPL